MLLNFKPTIRLKIAIIAVIVLGGASSYALSHHISRTTQSSEDSVTDSSGTSKDGSRTGEAEDAQSDSSQQKSSASKKTAGGTSSKKTSPVTSSTPGTSTTPTQPGGTPSGGGASGGGTCSTKPLGGNTGSSGTLASDGRTVLQTANEVVENKSFSDGIEIRGDGVQLKNVRVNGGILINEADDVVLDHVTAVSISVSSASNVTVQYAHVTAFEGDAFHITSDGSSYISNFTLRYSYIDRPGFNPGSLAHWDGIQIRGADNVSIFCNNFDAGTWQDPYNVLIYLEQANGGNDHIIVDNNWLNGSNFAIMAGLPNLPMNFSITNNKLFSADFHYGYCYLGGDYTPSYLAQVVQTGNTLDGSPMSQVCTDGDM